MGPVSVAPVANRPRSVHPHVPSKEMDNSMHLRLKHPGLYAKISLIGVCSVLLTAALVGLAMRLSGHYN